MRQTKLHTQVSPHVAVPTSFQVVRTGTVLARAPTETHGPHESAGPVCGRPGHGRPGHGRRGPAFLQLSCGFLLFPFKAYQVLPSFGVTPDGTCEVGLWTTVMLPSS